MSYLSHLSQINKCVISTKIYKTLFTLTLPLSVLGITTGTGAGGIFHPGIPPHPPQPQPGGANVGSP